ncbi:MAG: NosD domain-containing protein [Candidatus Thorarchaeota archaeon]
MDSLDDVSNGELVNNNCNSNDSGIFLHNSTSNIVANNTCNNNNWGGISLGGDDSNTVVNNTCNNNSGGIKLDGSDHNIVDNNICNNNGFSGINLYSSDSNTVSDNTCNNNRIGIYLYRSYSNTVTNNTFLDNTEYDIVEESYAGELAHREYVAGQFVWFLAGFGMILVVSVVMVARIRRMETHENQMPP